MKMMFAEFYAGIDKGTNKKVYLECSGGEAARFDDQSNLRCSRCHQPVGVVIPKGENSIPHFVHDPRNPACPLEENEQ